MQDPLRTRHGIILRTLSGLCTIHCVIRETSPLISPPVLNQAQLMELIMHAIQLASQQADESPPDDVQTPEFLPPPQHEAKNAFKSTLLKFFEELTFELSALK